MIIRVAIAVVALVLAWIAARKAVAATPMRSSDDPDEVAALVERLEHALQQLKRSVR
ncbi:MAG TPA: hypothetical protein VIV40_44435 [Kofleriaceae bacterium]